MENQHFGEIVTLKKLLMLINLIILKIRRLESLLKKSYQKIKKIFFI